MSIKTRLILLLSTVLVAAFAATSLVNYTVSRSAALKELTTSALPLTRDTIYSEILKNLMQPLHVSSLMANDNFLKEWAEQGEQDEGQIQRFLNGIHEKYGFFSTFFVSAKTMKYYHFNGVLKTISEADAHDVWYYAFIHTGKEYDLDVDTNQAADNTLTIFINFRVLDSKGKLLGVTGVGLKMDAVANIIRDTQARYLRRIYLVDPRGMIQAHMDTRLVEQVNIHDLPGIGQIAGAILDAGKDHVDLGYENEDGATQLTSRYIPELNWFLIVEQDERDVLGAARKNLMTTLSVGAVASLVIIAIVALAVNFFQGRLEFLAMHDELTGCLNRRSLDTYFQRAISRFARQGRNFAAIGMDLDNFKDINDKFGHLAGDGALRAVAGIVRAGIRPTDALFRFGGDEFLLLTECTETEADALVERLRQTLAVRSSALPSGPIEVSCGVAMYMPGMTLDALLSAADEAMYAEKARRKGGSCS
ncbi:sensor domain-containing diguanylate cyclase [Megalodesulfovibrio paquesii]